MLEYIVGNESHTSYWGKFYIKGLEKIQVKEDHKENRRDNHHNYQFYMADAERETIFTIFEQNGSKRGTDTVKFLICKVTDGQEVTHKAEYGNGFITGSFEVIAQGEGQIKGLRLLKWWTSKPADVNAQDYARHCAEYIQKRGVAVLPPLPKPEAA